MTVFSERSLSSSDVIMTGMLVYTTLYAIRLNELKRLVPETPDMNANLNAPSQNVRASTSPNHPFAIASIQKKN